MRFTRSSGIILHPISLPGPFGSGDLGASAYHFVDWLSTAGQSLWQMLPIGPSGLANSPYMSLSAFAGNHLLIDLIDLVSNGWLDKNELYITQSFQPHRVDYKEVTPFRIDKIQKAAKRFFELNVPEDIERFESFCLAEKAWLDDYALFAALNMKYANDDWTSWGNNFSKKDSSASARLTEELREHVNFHKFVQWCFSQQWSKLKKYANDKGIKLVGDIPIFVSHHSADVWTHPDLFYLNENGNPSVVAGVPPDYFSEYGQRWGNPLYRWDIMKENKYQWWVNRFERLFKFFDILRIDHFRGFESYWEIPEDEETAMNGRWKRGPGIEFFKTIQQKIGSLPIIAEDLGIITPAVMELREKTRFPGMKILQFAFSDGVDNFYLPHNFENNTVVYTGTHDNDTTIGWYKKATEHERDFVRRYCKTDGHEINWDLIKLALQSIADLAIIPFQDVIGLGSEGRMNFPGTIENNWEWRFSWDQVGPMPANRLYELTALYGRCNPQRLNLL
jgi:4-alpha-glucanotransferase